MTFKEVVTRWREVSRPSRWVVGLALATPLVLVFIFSWMFGWFDAGLARRVATVLGVYVLAIVITIPAWKLRGKVKGEADEIASSKAVATTAVFALVGVIATVGVVLWDAEFIGFPPAPLPSLSRGIGVDARGDVARGILVSHARTIAWDSITHGQSDYSILDSLGTRGYVIPVPRLHNAERKHLKAGRILWRVTIVNTPAHRGRGYPLLNLPEGVSYVLVHNYKQATEAEKDEYRSDSPHRHAGDIDPADTEIMGFADALIVPDSDAIPARVGPRRVVVKRHFSYWWNRPLARFRGPGDHHLWGDCGSHGCCEL